MSIPKMISMKRNSSFSKQHFAELVELKENNQLTDFRILCNNKVIKCHRVVLAAASPMLKTTMVTDMKEASKSEVNLDCIPYDILTTIIEYVYSGNIDIKVDDLQEMIKACNYLILDELKEFCVQNFPSVLSPANVIGWLRFADQLQLESISTRCKDIMSSSFAEIMMQEEFLDLSVAEVTDYVSDAGSKEVASNDILDAVMAWAENDRSTRINNLIDMMKKIKLEKCDIKRIQAVIKQYEQILDSAPTIYKLLTHAVICIHETILLAQSMSLLVAGGETTSKLWILDNNNQFNELASMPKETQFAWQSICEAPDGLIFTGGEGSTICVLFVIKTKSWKKLPNLRIARDRHGSVFVAGYLVIIGGDIANVTCARMDILSITQGDWQIGLDAPETLNCPRLAATGNDVFTLSQYTRKLYHMNITNKVWSSRSSLPGSGDIKWCSMTTTEDKLFVAGGAEKLCAWYTPATDTWCTSKQPRLVHHFAGLSLYRNKVMLLGGWQTDVVESYDQEKDEWQDMNIKTPEKLNNLYAFAVCK